MYDVVIIGAGMSGLAAGIRLAMFGQKVCILERHYAVGGLNSYYRLEGRNYDVGLHAITNFSPRGAKHGPLARLLRQLRFAWDDFELVEQDGSAVAFPSARLRFNNDPQLLCSEIERDFPAQADKYRQLLMTLLSYDELNLEAGKLSARKMLNATLSDPLLVEMLLCPVLFYGGPREHDMSWSQFSVMFRAIYLEGFARPRGGVRVIVKQLTRRYKQLGGELRLRAGVQRIVTDNNRAVGIVLDDGSEVSAKQIISSAGECETRKLSADEHQHSAPAGDPIPNHANPRRLSFIESIITLDCQPRELGFNDTILFYNQANRFNYAVPDDIVDLTSGIICSPNNYQYESGQRSVVCGQLSGEGEQNEGQASASGDGRRTTDNGPTKIHPTEGTLRFTALANFDRWLALSSDEYQAAKRLWYDRQLAAAEAFIPNVRQHIVAHDMFTPSTVVRFTGHEAGAVYGSPEKRYDARTQLENVLLCGSDQGFVGIVGTMTSGIFVANSVLRQRLEARGWRLAICH